MRSNRDTRRRGCTFTASGAAAFAPVSAVITPAAVVLVPVAAAIAAGQTQSLDPALVPIATWCWVTMLALLGWAASSLATLAGWMDGSAAERLKILQGIVASLLAGVIVFLLGRWYGAPEILNFVGVAGGGFMGDKYLMPLFTRVLGAIWPAANNAGGGPKP